MKGTYALIMRLPEPRMISIGNHPPTHFPAGYYVYVGSALGGIEARVNRHFRKVKKLHWHIDYLLAETPVIEVTAGETETRAECAVARTLGTQLEAIPGFGSSDCRCSSHLFLSPDDKQLAAAIRHAFESAGIKPELWKTRTGEK
ncbi:MAG TPA: GIY-YIG nuclease family protein [Dehalococcoidia bacterium]|nr:GIY-YIG nuclease family protein [Dehalococcoidia bacterium]